MSDPDAPDMAQATDPDVAQEPVGPANEQGGGEFPDPDTPPVEPAPGADPSTREAVEAERATASEEVDGRQRFKDVLDRVDPEVAGAQTMAPDDPDRPSAAGG